MEFNLERVLSQKNLYESTHFGYLTIKTKEEGK